MNRKKFVEQHNATCKNWRNSWSYVNHVEKVVIFGLWKHLSKGQNCGVIFSENWKIRHGRKQAGFGESLENIELIKTDEYKLKIFIMHAKPDSIGNDVATKIKRIEPELFDRTLIKIGADWFAEEPNESIYPPDTFGNESPLSEGTPSKETINVYERNPEARRKCLEHFDSYECQICGFDFEQKYGKLGIGYIHVHHLTPVSERGEYEVDPINDLLPVCPNCHAMLHRGRKNRSVEEIRNIIQQAKQH